MHTYFYLVYAYRAEVERVCCATEQRKLQVLGPLCWSSLVCSLTQATIDPSRLTRFQEMQERVRTMALPQHSARGALDACSQVGWAIFG
jgi:hypothetical protein